MNGVEGDTWTHLNMVMEIRRQKSDARENVDQENVDHGDHENEGMMLDREILVHDRRAIMVLNAIIMRSIGLSHLIKRSEFLGEIPFKNRSTLSLFLNS